MKKTWISLMLMACLSIAMIGCGSDGQNSNQKLASQQESLMQEGISQTGMPAVKNFTERKLMKTIIELRDQADLICYAYLYSQYTGKFTYLGRCIGFGLPYSTQYTNPEVPWTGYNGACTSLPQADPNLLFMPSSADASWVMLIDEKTNEPFAFYCEERVNIYQHQLPDRLVQK
jgi:hypothetical protein